MCAMQYSNTMQYMYMFYTAYILLSDSLGFQQGPPT